MQLIHPGDVNNLWDNCDANNFVGMLEEIYLPCTNLLLRFGASCTFFFLTV